jgi:uncharacterized membrane protein
MLTLALAACSSGSTSSPSAEQGDGAPPDFSMCGKAPATGTIPANVQAVMMAKCETCHGNPTQNAAPFSLVTYADVHAGFAGTDMPIYQVMWALIQPGSNPHMPFGNAPQLTPSEFTTLSDWLANCAPSGN